MTVWRHSFSWSMLFLINLNNNSSSVLITFSSEFLSFSSEFLSFSSDSFYICSLTAYIFLIHKGCLTLSCFTKKLFLIDNTCPKRHYYIYYSCKCLLNKPTFTIRYQILHDPVTKLDHYTLLI